MKIIQRILAVMVILVFAYIILGQLLLPANAPVNGLICETLPGDQWYRVKDDGTKAPYKLPGRADGDVIIETTLPEELDPDMDVLCFRGMGMKVYIDGELREDYSIESSPILGDRSAECYVMVSLYPEDAGKLLTVDYKYCSGMVYEVYIGTRFGIWAEMFSQFGLELFVGLAILLLALICLVASVFYRIIHHRYLEMTHLSLGVLIGACWVMSNSIFRQLYSNNVSIMSDTPFLMVILMPLPFVVFINSLQEGRYLKVLMGVAILEIADFVVCITLLLTGTMTLLQSFPIAAGCALISIMIILGTIALDVIRKQVTSYRIVAFGFAFLAVAAVFQIFMFQFAHNGVFSGLFMAIGLFGFMLFAIIHTIKQIIGIRLVANEAVQASKAKGDFLANMSHEIRTPLNGILGMDEMIIRDTKDSRIKKYALDIKGAGNTLLSLINDILDLSKIESGSFEIIGMDYDTASVLNDVINITRHKALSKDLGYNFTVAEDTPCRMNGDEIRIRQIMLNLINNAIKYTRAGRVDINVYVEDIDNGACDLVVCVEDTGIGIKKEDLDRLFTSFQRLDEEKNHNIEGTGLGLHITYKLVEMMNGRIEVESEYGTGSKFTVHLPQSIINPKPIGDFGKAVETYVKDMQMEEGTLSAPDASILVVDDNEMNLDVIKGLLRDTKARIDTVTSGAQCIEYVRAKRYDLILLDQMMPEMNGEMTLRELKRQDIVRGTPIIALTADAIVGARENYISMGFTDYLSKPVKYDRLEATLRTYLPQELQHERKIDDADLPTILLWGTNPTSLRDERERLEGIYKCVCVVGSEAKEKYLKKHEPDAVMQVM